MTLEERLDTLTQALNNTTAALQAIAGLATGGTTAPAPTAAASEEKAPAKKTAAKKAEKAEKAEAAETTSNDDATVTKETTDAVLAWLGEFAKEEDKANPAGVHPEVTARREALKKAYEGLGVKKLGEIKGDTDVARFGAWFDKAVAKGRFAPDPVESDDDMGI